MSVWPILWLVLTVVLTRPGLPRTPTRTKWKRTKKPIVSTTENVDVTSDIEFALGFFADTAEQGQGNGGFDVSVTVDGGSHGSDDLIYDLWISCEGTDVPFIFFCKSETGKLVVRFDDVIRFQDGGKDREAVAIIKSSMMQHEDSWMLE